MPVKKLLRSALSLLMAALLCYMCLQAVPALAEDVCVLDASKTGAVTTDCSYLRVCCPIDGEAGVTLTIRDAWGYLTYQRSYGMCSGTFRSEDVYLPLEGASTDYVVSLTCGNQAYECRVKRIAPRLTDSGVTAHGVSLAQLTGKAGNKFVVIVDVDALEGSTLTVPLVSGGVQLGYANLTVAGGALTVSTALTVDGSVEKSTVYVARDAVTATTLGTSRFTGEKGKLNRAIDLGGTPYAAVLVQLTVCYDATTAQAWQEDPWYVQTQQELWDLMRLTTANEAVG